MKKIISALTNGIIKENPVLILLLGMCSTLATSTGVINALGMGLSTAFVLIFSNMFISLLRNFIPNKIRIACYIVIIAGFVALLEMFLKAYIPSLSASLGIFIPLIVANCIPLARAEIFASKNNFFLSTLDGLGSGLGYTLALVLLATVREILGAGTFAGISLFGNWFQPLTILLLPPGGFISLGFLLAFFTIIKRKMEVKS